MKIIGANNLERVSLTTLLKKM